MTNEPRHDKTNKVTVLPAKTQISLGILPVWSKSSLCAQWVAKDPGFLHTDSEDSGQTGRMPRLIWVFAGHTHTLCWFCRVAAEIIFLPLIFNRVMSLDWSQNFVSTQYFENKLMNFDKNAYIRSKWECIIHIDTYIYSFIPWQMSKSCFSSMSENKQGLLPTFFVCQISTMESCRLYLGIWKSYTLMHFLPKHARQQK